MLGDTWAGITLSLDWSPPVRISTFGNVGTCVVVVVVVVVVTGVGETRQVGHLPELKPDSRKQKKTSCSDATVVDNIVVVVVVVVVVVDN